MKKISGMSLRSASVIVSVVASLIISLILSFAGGVITPTISNAQNTACLHHFAEQKAPIITKLALQTKTQTSWTNKLSTLHDSGVSFALMLLFFDFVPGAFVCFSCLQLCVKFATLLRCLRM